MRAALSRSSVATPHCEKKYSLERVPFYVSTKQSSGGGAVCNTSLLKDNHPKGHSR